MDKDNLTEARVVDYAFFAKSSCPRFESIFNLSTGQVLYKETLFPLAPVSSFSGSVQDFFVQSEKGGLVQWLDTSMFEFGIDYLTLDKDHDPIGINMSYLTINLAGDRIARRLSALPSKIRSKLCIELTETLFHVADIDSCVRFIHAMKDAGISIALDDYGTGFHETLPPFFKNSFQPDIIKIDHTLIEQEDIKSQRILSKICEYAFKYDIALVGERVRVEQIHKLVDSGIAYGQGWGLEKHMTQSHPVSALKENEFII